MCPSAPKKRASLPWFRASSARLRNRNANLDASTDVSFLKNSLYQFNGIILQTLVPDDDFAADEKVDDETSLNDVSYRINFKNQFNDFLF